MFRTKFITSLLEVVLGLLQPLQPVLHLQINVRFLKMVPNESPYQKPLVWYQNQVSHMIRTQFISSCHDAILGLLQTPHPVRDLQFEMRHLKMVPKHWVWHQNQVSSMSGTQDTISLLEIVLGLLRPLHPTLDLQIGLRLLKMVSNDSPYPKTWGLALKSSL